MKTLDEIIKRQDYVRMNSALIDRAQELAGIIRKKMVELDQETIAVNKLTFAVETRRSNISSDTSLYYLEHDYEAYDGYNHLNLEGMAGYLRNDFNCYITGASSHHYLAFLNSARDILNLLYEIETEKCNAITTALETTKDI